MNPAPSSRALLQRVPLRVTLVVALVLLAAVGLTATACVVTTQLRGYLVDQVDQDLTRLAGGRADSTCAAGRTDGEDNPFETSRDEYYALASPRGPGGVGQRVHDERRGPAPASASAIAAA